MLALSAEKVLLAGDFSGRDVNSLPMNKDKKGTRKVNVSLSPGRL